MKIILDMHTITPAFDLSLTQKTGEFMKTFKIILPLILISLSFFITNCYVPPNSILKLKPETQNNDWYKGKEIATLDNDSVTIRISYDRSYNNDYLFDIGVTNNSEKPLLVEPEKFSYKMIKGSIKLSDTLNIVTAKDPEIVILDLQKSNSLHQSNMETQSMIYSLGYFLQLAGQTKALVTGDVELSNRIDRQGHKMQEDPLIDDIENNRISESLEASAYVWEILALRKTTLFKDESISGKVFFPATEMAKTLEFNFPIGNYNLKILFTQEVIPLYKKYINPNIGY